MGEVKIEGIKRINGIYQLDSNSYVVNKTLYNGFIKTIKTKDKTLFNGLVINAEENDYRLMNAITDNLDDAYFVRGIIKNNKLNFTVFSNFGRCPVDYKLIYMGLYEYYGSCYNINFNIDYNDLAKMILSYKSNISDYARVTINDLNELTDIDIIEKSFGETMYRCYQKRLPMNVFLLKLISKEDTATVTEAFEKRSTMVAKTLLKDRNN